MEHDKNTLLKKLEKTNDTQLWDIFLKGQVDLFFKSESLWLATNPWWNSARNILEIGSGNGAFLHKLSKDFPTKIFRGVEKLPEFVKMAKTQYSAEGLIFLKGDAEVYDEKLKQSADIVLFHLTLQHLGNPTQAMENAHAYLKRNGHVVIIDSFDKAHKNSPPISAIDEAMLLVSEAQKGRSDSNRKISFELLQDLNSGSTELCNLYEIAFSNVDTQGNLVCDIIRSEGDASRLRYFKHALMLLTLFQRIYRVPVNFDRAYDELQAYIRDKNAWTSPGAHFLILKKIGLDME